MFTFQWKVAEGGYGWARADALDDPILIPQGEKVRRYYRHEGPPGQVVEGSEEEEKTRSHEPLMEHPALFHTFADVAPTFEGIKAFANVYGLLWEQDSPSTLLHPANILFPRYTHWVIHILLMRFAVTLWELERNNDTQVLATYVHWHESSIVSIDPHPDCRSDPLGPSLFRDVPGAAPLWNAVGIDSHLHSEDRDVTASLHVRHYFDPSQSSIFRRGDLVQPAGVYIRKLVRTILRHAGVGINITESLDWCLEPHTLLDALWLQFALAITEGKIYQKCPTCSKWFELSPGMNRADRLFCSNACRMRAYRQRIAKARTRYKAGATVEDIAHELETDENTARGWVTTKKRAREQKSSRL